LRNQRGTNKKDKKKREAEAKETKEEKQKQKETGLAALQLLGKVRRLRNR